MSFEIKTNCFTICEDKHVTPYQNQMCLRSNFDLTKSCLAGVECCDTYIQMTVPHYKRKWQKYITTWLLTCDRANWRYRYTPPMMPMLITNKAVRKRQTVVAVETRRARAFRIKYCGSAWAEASKSTFGGWNIHIVMDPHKHCYLSFILYV